ncbi:MAG TPA: glycosyltransferase family 39 protein, partial [Phycisphaerae bacterium]|nr:glycosyltransferase family 39 protein [Phycisphaerae bacterium]
MSPEQTADSRGGPDASGSITAAAGVFKPLSAGTEPIPSAARPVWFWGVFFVILLLGAFLRFWRLDNQSLWCDETATLMRICGNFHEVIAMLYGQGLSPVWYVFLWSWVQFLQHVLHVPAGLVFTPTVLRTPGAVLGVLNVAASYFLARQFTSRRVALLIMLLVAVNPFLVYYSRDLKMYGAFYFAITLNAALFFKFLSSPRWYWAPLYVLSAIAMVSIDFIGWIFFAVQLIWLIVKGVNLLIQLVWLNIKSRREPSAFSAWYSAFGRTGLVAAYWLAAFVPVGAFTAWWFRYHSYWLAKSIEIHSAIGLEWTKRFVPLDWTSLMDMPTVNLLGYQWPVYPPTQFMVDWFELGPNYLAHLSTRSLPWLASLEMWTAIGVFAVMLVGLIPWRRWFKRSSSASAPSTPSPANNPSAGRWWHVLLWLAIPAIYFYLASLPPDNPFSLPPHQIIWVPRYWGFITMAWIIWLGASIARLPGLPVRVVVVAAILAAMIPSALTDALIVRDEPWTYINTKILPYYDASNPNSTYIVYSHVLHSFDDEAVSWLVLEHIPPEPLQLTNQNINFPWTIAGDQWQNDVPNYYKLSLNFRNSNQPGFAYGENFSPWQRLINYARSPGGSQIHTLVLADRLGDINTGIVSTDVINQELGPDWKLVYQNNFNLYFEWRYYFYSPWRIRIWQHVPPKPPTTAPVSTG